MLNEYKKHYNMENKIKRIVKEAIRDTLNEISPSQKKRNNKDVERFFRKGKGGFNGIRTVVVLTAENPDSVQSSAQFNKNARHSLLKDLKNNKYAYVPAIGNFGGNTENPYAVFNMSVDSAKSLCGKYQQTSFVFTQLSEDGKIHSEYWEKNDINSPYDKTENDYVKKDDSEEWIDMAMADDNFTIIGNNFKYQIPFSIFESVNNLFTNNMKHMIEVERTRGNHSINENKILDFTINHVGMSPYLWRNGLIKSFYDKKYINYGII